MSDAAPLVVGVGASAGGLQAISVLLRAIPAGAPLGLVVLQHLDPAYPSNLAQLLARQTSMKVTLATEGALVEAGQVYVIPPGHDLRISSGRLQLVPRSSGPVHLPIDDFFASLARDQGRAAAGVVLSGTGTDGAKGVGALRAVGAATFAQDGSSQHAGMPEAAVATGCIDQVLSPAEIAAKLMEQLEEARVDGRPDDDSLQGVFERRAALNVPAQRRDPGGQVDAAHLNVEGSVGRLNEELQSTRALLKEARDYAEGIVDTVREPLLVLDERRDVRTANRSFCRKFEVRRDQVEGKSFASLGEGRWVPPVLIAALERLAERATKDEARLEDTPSLFAGRSMLVSGRPLLRGDGAPWLLLAFEDLTEQMKSDAAVRRSERALREMLGAASEAILIANGHGAVTYANEMAARTFKYPREELIGLSIEKLVPEDLRESHEPPAPVAGVMGASREVQGRRKDGSLFPAEVGLSVMEGEQGPLVVAFISDVTTRHESEARITAYKKNLQEMAFDAALAEERQRRKLAADLHDNIGQTLALAQIRLKAAQGSLEGDGARDLAEGIKLINVALTDTRELTFELSPPVLYDLGLPAAVAWLGEQLASQHHLRVVVEADQPFEKLEDETAGLLFRAVRELLTNVVKHAKTLEAWVSLHRRDSKLTVVVEDRGAGFDPGRLRNYETAKGFGLFSVREQMTRLGGTFTAISNPAQGTRITLQVPLIERKPVPAAPGETR